VALRAQQRPAGRAAQQELGDDLAAIALVVAARAVRVERPHDDRGKVVGAVKRPRVALPRKLGRTVHRPRECRMGLAHRHLLGRAVHLGARHVDESPDAGAARGHQQVERAAGVDLVVLDRRVDGVPHSQARQMEDGVDAAQQPADSANVANVDHVQLHLLGRQSSQVLPPPVAEVVDHHDPHVQRGELADQLRADETGPARHQHGLNGPVHCTHSSPHRERAPSAG